ncbi:hypothetical protein [Streptomyces liliifuscus]|uniref:Uncharacterized protein n=1 Tax=Streptomyces liliifuscus TaxID=2797636 RepID=A0A7T7KXB2_9ACTN|nr:hypothetical protein [Streptomyces liliifuscus]QQM41976.1 hypothetical protein JEQ17_22710 [Streptomyces liliifuscus]
MSNTTPGNRLYGMMQALMAAFAHDEDPPSAEDRGVVSEQDALDAVLHLAGFLDAHVEAGRIAAEDAEHMASMLMVIRERIRPLPVGLMERRGSETDGVTLDLQEMVEGLRTAREESGRQG